MTKEECRNCPCLKEKDITARPYDVCNFRFMGENIAKISACPKEKHHASNI